MTALRSSVRMSLVALLVAACAGAPPTVPPTSPSPETMSPPPATPSPSSGVTAAPATPSPVAASTPPPDEPPFVFVAAELPAPLDAVPPPRCEGGTTGGDVDYAPDAQGGSPDLETATRALRGVRWTDVIALEERRSGVVRDGRAIFTGSWSRSASGAWLLSSFQACGDAGISLTRPRGLIPDAMVEVMVDGLEIRVAPAADAARAQSDLTLRRGDEVLLVDGPVAADGQEWYLVQSVIGGQEAAAFGWVAAASPTGVVWIDDISEEHCPVVPDDVRQLGVTADELLLHCFGATELAFELDSGVSCHTFEGPLVKPAWFSLDCGSLSGDACGSCAIPLAVDPRFGALPAEQERGRWAFRGHFDDAAASTCRLADASGARAIDLARVVHRCRTTFVLTSLVRLGPSSD